MEKNVSCALVRDLLPNYIEKLTSEETDKVLEEHFSNCSECSLKRNMMMSSIETDKVPKEQKMVKYLRKTKMMYLLQGIFLSIGAIGIIVSFIVDLAINKQLTWSLIVDASVIYLYICVLTGMFSKKHQIINALAAASILILPLLYMIENVVNKNFVSNPADWFVNYALPISLIWIAIIWITVLVRYFMKVNILNTTGILLILATFGSALTNAIAKQVSITKIYVDGFEYINTALFLICAIACFTISYLKKGKTN